MKVLVLNGSPKKNSDTFRMTEAFLKGLKKCGTNETEIVNVIDKNIAACKGCFACWGRGDGHCVYDDDQNGILDLLSGADLVIWSFPLYSYSMPAHLKAVLDRTIPLVCPGMVREANGSVRHEARTDFSKLTTLVISGCGFPDFEGNFLALREMCRQCFRKSQIICVPEAPLFNIEEAAIVAEPKLAEFEQAGEEYAANGELSAETIKALETPMIPGEEYLRHVNGV